MTVWMCSGQGAQKPGMTVDLLDIDEVRSVFEAVSEGLSLDLIALAQNGKADEINRAIPAQALTFATSVGIGRALQARGLQPDAYVGFSLGQISALVLADVLSLEEGVELLRVRCEAMDVACKEHPGAMAALMGADHESVQALCDEVAHDEILVPANFNAPGQIVVSGEVAALERAEAAWKERGKKAVRLATAGGFHSPLMAQAGEAVWDVCQTLTFNEPSAPVICNTDAQEFTSTEAAHRLKKQVQQGVQFEQSIQRLIDQGQTEFVEVGFGGVLANLVRRIDKSMTRKPVGTREQFDAFVEEACA